MVPGKKYAPEDYLKIIWRRKWLIVAPLFVAAAGTFAYSLTLPNRYRSEATVLIIPQQVPQKFIAPTVDESVGPRLDLMRQQILSRGKLERILEEFDLYKEERQTLLMDQVIEQMRRDIDMRVQTVNNRRLNPNHFVVSYESTNPETARKVAERVASLFVRENLEGRSLQTEQAVTFLQRQVDESTRQLQEHDRRLEQFKVANTGRLPTEFETNVQLMTNARQQIVTLSDAIGRDRTRQIDLERMIGEETATLASLSAAPRPVTVDGGPGTAAQQLAAARAGLDNLLLRLKEDHPDVRIARSRIRDLEKAAEAEALQQPVSGTVTASPAEAEAQKRLAKLRLEYDNLGTEIQGKQIALKRAQGMLSDQESKLQAGPALQSELAELMRGHETLRKTHEGLLQKLQDAKLAASLEQQQVSQQFRIVDPARRPDSPFSPNRLKMNMMGALAGLGLGLLIVGVLEYRDTSLRTDEDVLVALSLPVLALVPVMHTPASRKWLPWRKLLGGGSAAGLIVVTLVTAWQSGLLRGWGG